jgi:hypothetical protein
MTGPRELQAYHERITEQERKPKAMMTTSTRLPNEEEPVKPEAAAKVAAILHAPAAAPAPPTPTSTIARKRRSAEGLTQEEHTAKYGARVPWAWQRTRPKAAPEPPAPAPAPVGIAAGLTKEQADKIRRLGDAIVSLNFTRDNAERALQGAVMERDAYLESLTVRAEKE